MITTLTELVQHAGGNATPYWIDLWFKGCYLEKNQLMCPDQATAERVARLFLPQLRGVISDLEIRVSTAPPFEKPVTGGWKATTKRSNFKKGHEPTDETLW